MSGFTVLIIMVWVTLSILKTTKKSANKKTSNSSSYSTAREDRNAQLRARASQMANSGKKNVSSRAQAMKYRATHADDNYDDHMLDYCDSDLPATRGITFRDLPEGADELLYLRRINHRRERELEKALMRHESEVIKNS